MLVKEMEDILKHISELNNITIENMEVMPDHVHMLISFKLKKSPTNIVKALNGGSGRLFLKQHPEIKQRQYWGGNLWSRSYYMSTLGNNSRKLYQ